MLQNKSVLEKFDLVEELDSQAAETISGGLTYMSTAVRVTTDSIGKMKERGESLMRKIDLTDAFDKSYSGTTTNKRVSAWFNENEYVLFLHFRPQEDLVFITTAGPNHDMARKLAWVAFDEY